jgi:hypothetical protein
MTLKNIGAAVAAVAFLAAAGNAAVTVSGDTGYTVPTGLVVGFDDPNAAGYTWDLGNAPAVTTGSLINIYAQPTGDASMYGYLTASQFVTLDTPTIDSMSIYIGSLDPYNIISFYSGDSLVQSFTGTQLAGYVPGALANGAYSGTFKFDFGGADVNKIQFLTYANSFEFDNIAVGAVPEPSMWVMLLAGFGLTGLFLRFRPKTGAVTA